jgi:glycosyltransferase involved in cell wall biosynthesis
MVSVIIPVYNSADSIGRCLDSIFRSDYNNFEVLIVDDYSRDDSIAEAEHFDCRIIRQPSNRGAAAARNRGSREANGQILFFLDADVFVDKGTLTFIVEDLAENDLASAVIGVYAIAQEIEGFFSQYQTLFTIFNHEQSKRYIGWFWTAMGAVKRDAFEDTGGFNEKYVGASAEDVELGYTLRKKGHRILYDNRIRGIHYHHHNLGSLIRNNFKKSAALVELVWKMSRDDKFAHGFSNRRNLYALIASYSMTASLLLAIIRPEWIILFAVSLVALVLCNLPFYGFLRREKGTTFILKTILLHYLIYTTVGVGSLLGTFRYYFNKNSLQEEY